MLSHAIEITLQRGIIYMSLFFLHYIEIPTLILLDENGDVITARGSNSVRSDPLGAVGHSKVIELIIHVCMHGYTELKI